MPSIKNIIIFLVIAAVFLSVYLFFKKDTPAPTTALVSSTPGSALVSTVLPSNGNEGVAKEFLDLLLSVKSIKLDDSIFSQNSFRSLHDSSITLIPDGTEGRPNPFAPIGSDAVSSFDNKNPNSIGSSSSTDNVLDDSNKNPENTSSTKPATSQNSPKPINSKKPPTSTNN